MFSTRLELIYLVTLGITNLIIPEYIFVENAEIVLINPLNPSVLGDLLKLGDTSRPPAGIILQLFRSSLLH
jgi:hypothetical protein